MNTKWEKEGSPHPPYITAVAFSLDSPAKIKINISSIPTDSSSQQQLSRQELAGNPSSRVWSFLNTPQETEFRARESPTAKEQVQPAKSKQKLPWSNNKQLTPAACQHQLACPTGRSLLGPALRSSKVLKGRSHHSHGHRAFPRRRHSEKLTTQPRPASPIHRVGTGPYTGSGIRVHAAL